MTDHIEPPHLQQADVTPSRNVWMPLLCAYCTYWHPQYDHVRAHVLKFHARRHYLHAVYPVLNRIAYE